jgi:3',5'-cyclic-AMP phosphodiesterase
VWFNREKGFHHCTSISEAADAVSVLSSQSGRYQPLQREPGDDANAIGAYPEQGMLGT